jgi:hypothetical protein
MVVVRTELAKSRPDVVAEVFRLLHESKTAAGAPKSPEPLPVRCRSLPPGPRSHDRLLPPAGADPGADERRQPVR